MVIQDGGLIAHAHCNRVGTPDQVALTAAARYSRQGTQPESNVGMNVSTNLCLIHVCTR